MKQDKGGRGLEKVKISMTSFMNGLFFCRQFIYNTNMSLIIHVKTG